MKRILIVHPDLGGGGAEKALINILNKMDYSKYSVTLMLLHKNGIYLDKLNRNVKLMWIHDPYKIKNKFFKKVYCKIMMSLFEKYPKLLHRILVGKKYNVEIGFLEGDATNFINNSINKKSNKIAWIHTDIRKYSEERRKKEEKNYTNINKIICVSKIAKDNFDNIYQQYRNKTMTIYNIVNIDEIIKLSQEKIEYEYNCPTIISVGRLVEEKRFDLFIKAHSELIKEGINHKAIILGTGKLELQLKELIKDLNVENSFQLLGFKENPYPYIKNADIFVMASDFEGLSMVIFEAIALKKIIVSTKFDAAKELLSNESTATLVDCGDYMALKEAIKKILVNKKNTNEYKKRSEYKIKIFESGNIMKKIYDVLDNY